MEQSKPYEVHFPISEFQTELLDWYHRHRRSLPWRDHPTPYFIWISEIMLQQTRVEAVLGYFERFTKRLPGLEDLAEVGDEELHKLWEGLGYYNRAKNLKKAARLVLEDYGAELPSSYEELLKLPGIGPYTAGAIASIAFGKRVAAIDGNVLRVFSRLRRDGRDIGSEATKKEVGTYVKSLIPAEEAADFNQALMELGALICLPNGAPKCEICPLKSFCLAHGAGDEIAYPVKKASKKRRIEQRTILVTANSRGEFLIQKRREKGLLSGLWEFPSLEGHYEEEELRAKLKELGLVPSALYPIEAAKHIFSHIEWHMEGYLVLLSKYDDISISGDDDSSLVSEAGLLDGRIDSSSHQKRLWVGSEALKKTYSIPSAFQVYMKSIEQGLVSTILHGDKREL